MLVFKGHKTYEDYIRTIANGMTSNTYEFKMGQENERGLGYLVKMSDDKKDKVIDVLNCIDKDMTEIPNKDEMYRKLSYFLKVGILFAEYDDCITTLSKEAISTLLIENNFSMNDDLTRKYISILADNDFLLYLRNSYNNGERDDIMFAITNHFDSNPFDIHNDKELIKFRKTVIQKLKQNKQSFIDEVMNFSDLTDKIWKNLQQQEGRNR